MSKFRDLSDIRRDYGELSLNESLAQNDPIAQFRLWFEDVLTNEKNDPTAMVLSTTDAQGHPDSRVVLLKGIEAGNFIFYTNYLSTKGQQIAANPHVALNFYWPQMSRQVRIRGSIEKINCKDSDKYFSTRPYKSQLSAIISPQSQEISRSALEAAFNALLDTKQAPLVRPDNWGGYQVIPSEFEFWQGRDNRLHDRVQYKKQEEKWMHHQLAP